MVNNYFHFIFFSKLSAKLNVDVVNIPWGEYNIEVRNYLPLSEKTEMVSKIINKSSDNNGYYNPFKVRMYLTLETVYRFTNLTFTEKQREDELKLYDIIVSSELFDKVVSAIPEVEWKNLHETVWSTITNIYEYKNSAMGILDAVSSDYNNMNLDATNIQAALGDSENLGLLRDIMTKLG